MTFARHQAVRVSACKCKHRLIFWHEGRAICECEHLVSWEEGERDETGGGDLLSLTPQKSLAEVLLLSY